MPDLTATELAALITLRDRGFALTVLAPDELGGLDADTVERAMLSVADDVIFSIGTGRIKAEY